VKTVADETTPEESTWSDHEVSRQIAAEAGRLLVELRRSVPESADDRWLRDQGDARSHRMIMDRLAELRPDDAILSEEGKDDQERLRHQRVWVIDPLDGTREFGEPPRDDWAVHVALCVGGEPVVGSVYMGSAGAKAMTVVSGGADIYLHAGGQYEWDSAAPVAVAIAAGLHCSRIDGSPLVYNQPNPYLPDLLICKRSIAQRVLALVAAHGEPVDTGSDAVAPGSGF
jgi:3'(2'), 5'-bisphosphate nucleotidase